MSTYHDIIMLLNKEAVITASGFALGFFWQFRANKQTLNFPLSTIFGAAIDGFWCSLGASIVSGFVPIPFRAVIPIACGVSIIYANIFQPAEKRRECQRKDCHCRDDITQTDKIDKID